MPLDSETLHDFVIAGGGPAGAAAALVLAQNGKRVLLTDPILGENAPTGIYSGLRGAQALLGELQGQSTLRSFNKELDNVWAAYREHHQAAYTAEERWRSEMFWRRRIAKP